MTRQLWETIADLIDAVDSDALRDLDLALSEVHFDLPVECLFVRTNVGFQLLVDAPAQRVVAGIGRRPVHLRFAAAHLDLTPHAVDTQRTDRATTRKSRHV